MNALHRIGAGTFLAAAVGSAGCGERKRSRALDPVAFRQRRMPCLRHDHQRLPGPKGQAVEKGGVKKFCSTAEMLGWWLQPENRLLDAKLYVHDMGRSVWENRMTVT